MFRNTVYGTTVKDVPFVPLQSATFCVQCELIITSRHTYCLACGSKALIWLSRVLGGSLRNPQTGTVPIANANYQTAAGDSILWNRTQALALFNALTDNKSVPAGLLTGTQVG